MPKHEIFHKAGQKVSNEIKAIVAQYFDSKELERLERLGGRILISVSTPYKPKSKKNIVVDKKFIQSLITNRTNIDLLMTELNQLTVKQLKEVCKLLNRSVPSNALSEEIKRYIIQTLQAEDYWNSISKSKT